MENTQNTQNPQAQINQLQAQRITQIIQQAGLDPNNAQMQQAAVEVLNNVQQLQDPAREKEKNAIMREFGIQPDEMQKALAGLEQQARMALAADNQLRVKGEELQKKAGSKNTLASLIGLGVAVLAGFLTTRTDKYKGFGETTWKKVASVIGAGALGTLLGRGLAYLGMVKPVVKEHQQTLGQIETNQATLAQIDAKAQEVEYNAFVGLASKMLKERVEKKTEAPAIQAPVTTQEVPGAGFASNMQQGTITPDAIKVQQAAAAAAGTSLTQ